MAVLGPVQARTLHSIGAAHLAIRGFKQPAIKPQIKRQLTEPGGPALSGDEGDEETVTPEDGLVYDASVEELPVDPYAAYGYPPEVLADPAVQAAIKSVAAEQGYPGVGGGPAPTDDMAIIDSSPIVDVESSGPTPTGGRGMEDDEEEYEEDDLESPTSTRGRGTSTSLSGTSRTSNKNTTTDEEEEEEEGAGVKLSSKFGWTMLAALGASYFAFDGMW